MAYQPLHHKYRPQRLAELVGQQAIATTLANALRTGRIAPAYLFCGPRGTGKTSSARILARSLNCLASDGPTPEPCGRCELCTSITAGNALDVIEIDAASNTGVDNIRELIERSRFAPVQARWKVYVVDECHMLSTAAFNALLKTLEEPPPRVVFVLATTDPQRVLPTILSRCQRFDFRRIPLEALDKHLTWIAEQEEIAITPEALHLVAQRAQGGLRDAESLLDQLSLLPAPIEAAAVWDLIGAVPEEELLTLAGAMAGGDPLAVVEACRQLLERGREPNAVLQGIVSLLRDVLLAGVAPDRLELTSVSPPLRGQLPPLAGVIGKDRLLRWQAALKSSEQQLRHSMQPRLWLEVLLLGMLAEPLAPAAAVAPAPARSQQAEATVAYPASAGIPPPAAYAPPPSAPPAEAALPASSPQAAPGTVALDDLWQQILAGLQLPSTRMLLSQQARLWQLDDRRAIVRVASNWLSMVQSRLPLLEKAMEATLGSTRQITLEPSDRDERAVSVASSVPPDAAAPPPVSASLTTPPRPAEVPSHPPAPLPGSAPATPPASPPPAALPRDPAPAAPAPMGADSPPANQPQPPLATPGLPPMPEALTRPEPQTTAEAQTKPAVSRGERVLEESASLFADFFNGQVIALDLENDG
jgi:DNA polymerase-3 subunit gamma/tau